MKKFFTGVFQTNLFIDTEELSEMQISSQVIFKDIVNRFRATYLKMYFFEIIFQTICC